MRVVVDVLSRIAIGVIPVVDVEAEVLGRCDRDCFTQDCSRGANAAFTVVDADGTIFIGDVAGKVKILVNVWKLCVTNIVSGLKIRVLGDVNGFFVAGSIAVGSNQHVVHVDVSRCEDRVSAVADYHLLAVGNRDVVHLHCERSFVGNDNASPRSRVESSA